MEYVILVDEKDNAIGLMEKMEAHEKGLLHRAFSVFVFNQKGELLIHQRADEKYHCGGLWTNTCCSHPRDGETVLQAAHRRLVEEMGFDCMLEEQFSFVYKAEFDNGLTEYEYDHVLTGTFSEKPNLNPEEVKAYRYISMEELKAEIASNPEAFTPWFKIALEQFNKEGVSISVN